MSCLLHCWNDISVFRGIALLMHVVSANSLWQLHQLQGIASGEVVHCPMEHPVVLVRTSLQISSCHQGALCISVYQLGVLSSRVQLLWPLLNHIRSVSLLCWPNHRKVVVRMWAWAWMERRPAMRRCGR